MTVFASIMKISLIWVTLTFVPTKNNLTFMYWNFNHKTKNYKQLLNVNRIFNWTEIDNVPSSTMMRLWDNCYSCNTSKKKMHLKIARQLHFCERNILRINDMLFVMVFIVRSGSISFDQSFMQHAVFVANKCYAIIIINNFMVSCMHALHMQMYVAVFTRGFLFCCIAPSKFSARRN